jgi:hypothetical protein
MADLHGKLARIVAEDLQDPVSAAAPSAPDVVTIALQREARATAAADCAAADPAAWAAYAVVSGVDPDALAGTQFLVDAQGWLRTRAQRGEADALVAAIAEIRANPLAAPVERGHLHAP